jgi:hypothetical protein
VFLWSKLRGGDGKVHIFLIGSVIFSGSACTNIDTFNRHAEVGLTIGDLQNVEQNVDLSFNADGAQSSLVASISLLGRIFNRIQHSPFGLARSPVSQACPQRPTSVQSRSRNPVPPVFSPPLCGSSRTLCSKKLLRQGPSLTLRPRGSGPFWQMNGQASPEEQSS